MSTKVEHLNSFIKVTCTANCCAHLKVNQWLWKQYEYKQFATSTEQKEIPITRKSICINEQIRKGTWILHIVALPGTGDLLGIWCTKVKQIKTLFLHTNINLYTAKSIYANILKNLKGMKISEIIYVFMQYSKHWFISEIPISRLQNILQREFLFGIL